ncbi:peptide-methionine (S)-S-oxide reductase MsrA [Diaphorobacter aerolatus]|uniref:Peptide methionine sulfoxide reductase MsrA n=1 Tax=Diaphorobacter aerolatus TaxID=1288495 RepID=A0A7H0GKV9_9BURK|nr:peptide-methionine (S)-S-oxide reductase MsrA [Diaphorobacter aerolatus]QNP48925.1 peptide-methionine (S)-S-oxide reductase MsrA [Diaphorobacter aerolatus]
MDKEPTIYLGGGCFWCTEAVFDRVNGVTDVQSGYANGHVDHPTYEQICDGNTGHAEVVKLTFDPAVISLRQILEIFFATHDPTTLNRQGNDVGTQYRSAIYYTSDEQKQVIDQLLREIGQDKLFGVPVVTEVEPLKSYWPAEDYHQDYFLQHPNQGYCAFVVGPKVDKFRKTFAGLLKPGA